MELTSTVSQHLQQPRRGQEVLQQPEHLEQSYRGQQYHHPLGGSHDYHHSPVGGQEYSEQPPQSPEGRGLTMASVESPVLGESVSMYQVKVP